MRVNGAGLATFTLIDSHGIKTPRIAETNSRAESRLKRISRLGKSHILVEEVVLLHDQSEFIEVGKIDSLEYAALGRIACRNYCVVRNIIPV